MTGTAAIAVQGRALEVRTIAARAPGLPALVFLHEGLGSVSLWRDFPDQVAAATGLGAVVYSRHGHGRSEARATAHAVDYMHREALDVLPALLAALGVARPLLVGHSDGASIAIIHAGAGHAVAGLVLMAPHVFVEELSIASIARVRTTFETTDMAAKLARHHVDAAGTFYRWNDVWLHPGFRAWNIEGYLGTIESPVLVIQGEDDEYGTMAQPAAIAAQCAGPVERVALARCGHSPHRDQPAATLAATSAFVHAVTGHADAPGAA
jgi:pimeloyl-ACP methyl ester carboxylesterase